jgi:hypothetical protein
MTMIEQVHEMLRQTPRAIEALIAGATEEALTFRDAPGAWNSVEVLSHLADGEITDWMPRIKKIRSGGGRFTPFDREGGFLRYKGWTAVALVGEFAQLRRANLDALDAMCLTSTDLDKTGEHPELGRVTLRQLLACWATHDLAHVAQISRLLTRSFGRHVGPWVEYFSLLKDWQAPRSV